MRVKNIFVQKINDDHVHRLSEQQNMCNVAHLIRWLTGESSGKKSNYRKFIYL